MIIVNVDYIPDREIAQVLGLVKGSCVRAKHVGKDIRAAGRSLIGGEMKYYSELLMESRDTATKRMIGEAKKLGADAIINVRYQTAMVTVGASEVLAYGTAVKLNRYFSTKSISQKNGRSRRPPRAGGSGPAEGRKVGEASP